MCNSYVLQQRTTQQTNLLFCRMGTFQYKSHLQLLSSMCILKDFYISMYLSNILCLVPLSPSGVSQRGSAVLSRTRCGEGQPAETLIIIQEVRASGRGRRPRLGVRLTGPGPREEQAEGQTVRHPAGPSRAKGIATEARRHPRGRFIRGRD